MHFPSSTDLRRLLRRAMDGSASEPEVTELAKLAFTIASIRIKQLVSSGRLYIRSFNIPLDGIAFDCIAELFERDEDGVFVELSSCFSGDRDPSTLSDEELMHCFRQTIFLAITDGIYRIYRENDPILGRIIRNLKLALRHESSLASVLRFGQIYICINGHHDTLAHLPEIPADELERRLTAILGVGETSVSAMQAVARFLEQETSHRRMIPLVDVAVVFKRIATRTELPISSISLVNETLLEEDISSIVNRAGSAAVFVLKQRYVDGGKITDETFTGYAVAIRNILRDTFVNNDGSERTQAEYLQQAIAGLTYDEYRMSHRSAFEYMVRVAKRIVKKELRELF